MALELEVVKTFLRVEHDADDPIINLLIRSSKSFVESYLNRKLEDFEGGYPDEFDVAMLYVIQQWYDQRAITTFYASEERGLGFAFSLILDRYRFKKFAFLGYPQLDTETGLFSYEYSNGGTLDLNMVDTDQALYGEE